MATIYGEKFGVMITCSRCGHQEFVETSVPNDHYMPIGALPNGWLRSNHFLYLCPTCSIPFKRFMTWFFDDGQCDSNWRFEKGEDV